MDCYLKLWAKMIKPPLPAVAWMRNAPHSLVYLFEHWSPVGGTLWEGGCSFAGGSVSPGAAFHVNSLESLPIHSVPCACIWRCGLPALLPCLPLAAVFPWHYRLSPSGTIFFPSIALAMVFYHSNKKELVHTALSNHFPKDLALNSDCIGSQARNMWPFA